MTDEQKRAFEEAKKALDFPSHTSGSFVPSTLISVRSLFELEALARIGAAVQPRPGRPPLGESALLFIAAVKNSPHPSNNRPPMVALSPGWHGDRTVEAHIPLSALPQVKP